MSSSSGFVFPIEPIRSRLAEMDPAVSWSATQQPDLAHLLGVRDHAGALDPQRALVVGDRGTGKSYWSATLRDDASRRHVAHRYPRLDLARTRVALGFSDAAIGAEHPSPRQLKSLRGDGFDTNAIWRSVLLALAPYPTKNLPEAGWKARVEWVTQDDDFRSDAFVALDRQLAEKGETYLVVFDALDRLADSWADIRDLTAGLLRLALELRALKRIKIKLFMRPGMADDNKLWAVGDSSKLRHNEVSLQWRRRDLYALLWMRLTNDRGAGECFREAIEKNLRISFNSDDGIWIPSDELLENEETQRMVFYAMAGQYMGKTHKQGRTYDWAPNHLANTSGYATPRSFLIAMQTAARSATSAATIFDVAGIQQAVRKASDIRLQELEEDYRWINTVFLPLEGMLVPVSRQELIDRWLSRNTITAIQRGAENNDERYLPPVELDGAVTDQDGCSGLIDALTRLKIIDPMEDGRFNVPDLFRLAMKVKRRGGIKLRP